MSLTLSVDHDYLDKLEVHAINEFPQILANEANRLLRDSAMPGLEGIEDPITHISNRLPALHVIGLSGGKLHGYMALNFAEKFSTYTPDQTQRLIFPLAMTASPQGAGIMTELLTQLIPAITDQNPKLIAIAKKVGINQPRAMAAFAHPIMVMNTRIRGLARVFASILYENDYVPTTNAAQIALAPIGQIKLEKKESSSLLSLIEGSEHAIDIQNQKLPIRLDTTVTYTMPSFIATKSALSKALPALAWQDLGHDMTIWLEKDIQAYQEAVAYLKTSLLQTKQPNKVDGQSMQQEFRIAMERQ